ncbi:sensor domain-containing diguanylate cyclase [Vibrio cholerae]|uniref:sensor domain-containing diguanylate cyclase n=1 Tax=Vibrio cholerae TaxID=666 RepID=UPI0013B3AD72|nr:diguanylate cyclase [Vibrio cholerae]EHP5028438.1 diguanylate cyclase [Vibrio cholerae]EJL6291319.1 diguanylate cyclase [Vibrio cholerae]EKF9798743.1 diguanylate cyclase [Vibrio cholerae]MCX9596846.1 diguanylate cyclase [Vibrio cholerae]GIB31717.1 GGDEF family protein [Vibrio cholerae]
MLKHVRVIVPLLVLLFSLLLTVFVVYTAYSLQLRHNRTLLENLADRQTMALQQFVDSDIHFIGSAANFFRSSTSDDWVRFHTFAEETLKGSQSLIALQWLVKVEPPQAETFTARMQQRFPEFTLYTVPKTGEIKYGFGTDDQAKYVLSDIYPLNYDNRKLLGFYSERERFKRILADIVVNRRPNVSDKVRLLQDGIDKSIVKDGMLVYHPVFSSEDDRSLLGVMVGVVRLSTYFEKLVQISVMEQDLDMRVIDTGFDSEDSPVLYQSPMWRADDEPKIERKLVLPNRDWVLEFELHQPINHSEEWVLLGLGLGGVIISLLLSYIMRMQLEEKQRLTDMIEERTAELRYLVEHDSLTHIYNRRFFSQHLCKMLDEKQSFTLISFDIDRFKQINDSYGHLAGDYALTHVVDVVKKELVESDIFARFGGDEFAILSSVTDETALYTYLERIRKVVEAEPVMLNAEAPLTLTISIGASINCEYSEPEILQSVDDQLYLSKSKGRNRVSIAQQCSKVESNYAFNSGRMFDFM